MAGWITVHGWTDWTHIHTHAPDVLRVNVQHISGVFPKRVKDKAYATLLFVNCELTVCEPAAEVYALIQAALVGE